MGLKSTTFSKFSYILEIRIGKDPNFLHNSNGSVPPNSNIIRNDVVKFVSKVHFLSILYCIPSLTSQFRASPLLFLVSHLLTTGERSITIHLPFLRSSVAPLLPLEFILPSLPSCFGCFAFSRGQTRRFLLTPTTLPARPVVLVF